MRGAWIEMSGFVTCTKRTPCRSPCGERGLKCQRQHHCVFPSSRSPCGERGLKCFFALLRSHRFSRSPCGERGLKCGCRSGMQSELRRSPCGERGLKSLVELGRQRKQLLSLPVRGAWIEMSPSRCAANRHYCRSPCGERGLKYLVGVCFALHKRVAPRAGSVD